MLSGHPKGLYLLFFTEMAERFSYYGMRALFVLYLVSAFYTPDNASHIYGSYTGLIYLTPLLGGYIADRYWGNRRSIIFGGVIMAIGQFLMFASACTVSQSIFTPGGAIDSNVDNTLSLFLMFAGLAALIFGNGFFKSTISTMVGSLYDVNDTRKDSAFTIFYMGINLGSLMAPLVCGSLGTGNWASPGNFKWGFFCAGCGMLVSLIIFTLFKNKYLVTPDGIDVGTPPTKDRKPQDTDKVHATTSTGNSPFRAAGCMALMAVLMYAFASVTNDLNGWITALIYSCSIVLPIFIITDRSLTRTDKMRIAVIYIIAVFVIFFWSAFEQAGSSLTLFAEYQCDRHIGSWQMPTTWFQSVNPIVVVAFAPVMATLWETLAKHNMEPSSPVKQAIGLALLAFGYLLIAYATYGVDADTKISMWWLVTLYFIHTIGELTVSPIGLSMVSKLAPVHIASLLMGVWFMSNAASNVLAGQLASLLPAEGKKASTLLGVFEISSLSDFFLIFAIMAGIAAILLFALCPVVKRMSKGIL